jgi:hypothetical protein
MVLEINKISHAIKLIWIYFLQYSFATEAAYSSPLYNTSSDTTGAYEAGGGGGGIAFAQPPPHTWKIQGELGRFGRRPFVGKVKVLLVFFIYPSRFRKSYYF